MTPALFALIILALAIYGIERNHARHRHLRGRLAGSTTAEDRDAARVQADLATAGAQPAGVAKGTAYSPARRFSTRSTLASS